MGSYLNPNAMAFRKSLNSEIFIIRSRRRTMSLQIDAEGTVTVRAPIHVPEREIRDFVDSRENWIRKTLDKVGQTAERAQSEGRLTMEEIRTLADRALKEIPPRVKYWSQIMGVSYTKITIRNQKTRWGSCTAQGHLNFNCLLMLAPPEVLDSVVVHELCHLKHMDHSPAFYQEVRQYYPEYDRWTDWLKKNGPVLMRRMTG